MNKHLLLKIGYWIIASVLIALLLQNSIANFWNAWLIALFFLPAALIVKFGFEKANLLKGVKKWIHYFYIAMLSLYWGYIAIAVAYWYFLELKADLLDKVLISPVFIWLIIGFFVLLEFMFFKKVQPKEQETITIYSDRKKTTINIENLAYIESRGEFTLAVLVDGKEFKNNMRISEWKQRLNGFLRIHRSFLVNPRYATLNGNEVVVNAQWNFPISRTYKQQVLSYFENSVQL